MKRHLPAHVYDKKGVLYFQRRARAALAATAAAPQPAPEREARETLVTTVQSAIKELIDRDPECNEGEMAEVALDALLARVDREIDEAFLSLCEAVGVPATKCAAQEYRARSVPDRDALVDVIEKAGAIWRQSPAKERDEKSMSEAQADALLARGLRLPGGDETMAWAVVDCQGAIRAAFTWSVRARHERATGERVVRVAIRVVEGGDDAA